MRDWVSVWCKHVPWDEGVRGGEGRVAVVGYEGTGSVSYLLVTAQWAEGGL